jgi:hypothetical protein
MNKENVIYKFPPMGYYSNIKKKKEEEWNCLFNQSCWRTGYPRVED